MQNLFLHETKQSFPDLWIPLDNIRVVKIYIFLSFEECGSRLRVSNTSEYISTPFYPEFPEVTLLCSWNVSADHDYTLTIKEVHKTNFSTNSSDQDYLMVNDIKYLLSNVTRGMKRSFSGKDTLRIVMRVRKTSVLTEIRPIHGQCCF